MRIWGIILLFIIYSCSKTELIEPAGFETNIVADSIVFAVIGDYGSAGEPEKLVSDMVKSWNPDFIVTLGDNNYVEGKLKTLKENISQYYKDYIYNYDAPSEFRCKGKAFDEETNRFFPTPGNHDANNKDKLIPYFNFFTLPGNENYYKFCWGPVCFFSLNSVTGNMEEQKIWLEQQLAESVSPFNIVYFHHPPFSSGPHGNNVKMQWSFYNLGINAVFSGHDHIYNRIEKKGEGGMVYIVNGLGGRTSNECNISALSSETFDSFCYDVDYGAIKATATEERLVVEFFSISSPLHSIDSIVFTRLE